VTGTILTRMNDADKDLIDEKFKGVYNLFEEKLNNIERVMTEMVEKQKEANHKVSKHDEHIILARKESADRIVTLKKINTSLNTMMRRVESCENKNIKEDVAHTEIIKKVNEVKKRMDNASSIKPLVSAMKKPIMFGGIFFLLVSIISAIIVETGLAKVIIKFFS